MKRIPRRQRRLSNVTNKLPNIELKMLMYFIHSSVFSRFSKRYLSLDILSVTKSMSMLSHPASSWSSWSLPPEFSWLWQSKRNLSALAAVRSSNKNSLYALVGVSRNFYLSFLGHRPQLNLEPKLIPIYANLVQAPPIRRHGMKY